MCIGVSESDFWNQVGRKRDDSLDLIWSTECKASSLLLEKDAEPRRAGGQLTCPGGRLDRCRFFYGDGASTGHSGTDRWSGLAQSLPATD